MKKLLTLLAAILVSAQTGYCAGSALQGLEALSDVENISVPAAGAAKAMEGDAYKADQALAQLSDLPGATAYEKLENLFNEGTPAVKEDMTGWYSGRHVWRYLPDSFMGALLIGKDKPSDGGPLFSGDLLSVIIAGNNDAPDHFDKNLPAWEIAYFGGPREAGTAAFPDASANFNPKYGTKGVAHFRKARGYLVEHYSHVENNGDLTTHSYAYYFLNVTPKN